jgi:hypothetical protein
MEIYHVVDQQKKDNLGFLTMITDSLLTTCYRLDRLTHEHLLEHETIHQKMVWHDNPQIKLPPEKREL